MVNYLAKQFRYCVDFKRAGPFENIDRSLFGCGRGGDGTSKYISR